MKEKISIITGIGIAVFVIVTLAFYLLNAGDIDLNEIVMVGIAAILVVLSSYLLWDRLKNIKQGLPAKDERLTNISNKAGYYGFIAAIWSAVGTNLLSKILFDIELSSNHLTAAIVLFSGVVFIMAFLIMNWKGSLE